MRGRRNIKGGSPGSSRRTRRERCEPGWELRGQKRTVQRVKGRGVGQRVKVKVYVRCNIEGESWSR